MDDRLRRSIRRLWDRWEPTKVKDLVKQSLFSTVYRACKEWQGWTGNGHFLDRLDFARRMVFITIEQGWRAGVRAIRQALLDVRG